MNEQIKCPFCNKKLNTELIAKFWFCNNCEVAVRKDDDMPSRNKNIYKKDWVESQENNRYILTKSRYLANIIKRLHGVRRILDVGCGTGILVDILSRNGFKVTGIDSSPEAIEFAKKNKLGNFELSSIESFNYQGKFDLIVAAQLIEHMRYPEEFLKKINNLLIKSGYLILETPNLNSWSQKSFWRRRIGGMHYGLDHRICYTRRGLNRLLLRNNYLICKELTRTYTPTILHEFIKTIGIKKLDRIQCNTQNFYISPIKNLKKIIYNKVINSLFINLVLFLPNRISEINYRGNQLIVIARKKE